MSSSPWETARSLIAASGLGFAGAALGSACLDYAGEDFGTCAANDAGSKDDTSTVDCGAPTASDGGVVIGSGSGSATP
ncbi:MAG: hypothetical protein ABI193_21815 [Minicystis sp.]